MTVFLRSWIMFYFGDTLCEPPNRFKWSCRYNMSNALILLKGYTIFMTMLLFFPYMFDYINPDIFFY